MPPKFDLPEDKPEIPVCEHKFNKATEIQTEYSDDLCERVVEHGQHGLFIEGFAGKEKVCMDSICKWLSNPIDYPEFNSAVKVSISASIHFWNELLLHSLNHFDLCGSAVPVIRQILADIMKSTPKELRDGLFNNLHQKSAEELEAEEKGKQQVKLVDAMTGGAVS